MPRAAGGATKKPRPSADVGFVQAEILPDPDAAGFFADLDDVEDFTNSLYYGREGSGKTTGACRLVNSRTTGRLLVINAEGGIKKVALRKRGVDVSRIEVWPNPKSKTRITHKSLLQVYNKISADLEKDPESWTGVVIDSATEVYQAILDSVQEKRVNALKAKGASVDENHVDIADYGDMSKMFRDIMRKFRDLPCHVIFTALERRDVDKDTGKPQYGPAVTPGLQADLLGYVDFVLMFKAEDEDGPFRALTRANSRYRAKDRFDVLPRVLAEPTADRILQYLSGDLEAETDPFQEDLPARAVKAQDKVVEEDDEDEEDDDSTDE